MVYNVVACGGTFDHLHAGHKAFLRFAFSVGRKVLIGLTTDTYIFNTKNTETIAPFSERKQQLEAFLNKENFSGRFTITPIDTLFGPAIEPTTSIDALVATEETKKGTEKINNEREKRGLFPLPVILMLVVVVNGNRISSTQIRAGKINTNGEKFITDDITSKVLYLPDELREMLQKPFGKLQKSENIVFSDIDPMKSVTVGDATTVTFHTQGLHPKIAVVDFAVQRKKIYTNLLEEGFSSNEEEFHAINPSGTITPQLWQVLQKVVDNSSKSSVVTIDGEEDLAVLPLLLLLPLGFCVYYGQPNEGIVSILVTIAIKDRVKSLLQQFNRA